MNKTMVLLGAVACLMGITTLTVFAEDGDAGERQFALGDTRWEDSRITAAARFGDTEEYVVDALIPVLGGDHSRSFLNLRGTFLQDREQEVSIGLVHRYLCQKYPLIGGLNLFFDTRWTEESNTFHQLGGGLELLSQWFDLRANYYYPLSDQRTLSEFTETSTRQEGARRISEVITYRSFEEPLEGYDAEVGVWLPFLASRLPTGVFVGYYEFRSDYVPDFSGWKARLEMRPHPNLTLDAEWFEDDALNETDYFVGFRVNLPFDFWNGVGFDRRQDERSRVRGFEARMADFVHRDFRIRTVNTGPVEIDRTAQAQQAQAQTQTPAPEAPQRNCRQEIIDYEDDMVTPIFITICD